MPERVTGWKFDPRDTPEQKRILRTWAPAQKVRRDFPADTKVRVRGAREPMVGTVDRHIPGRNAQGGDLMVVWENGERGRLGPINAERVN